MPIFESLKKLAAGLGVKKNAAGQSPANLVIKRVSAANHTTLDLISLAGRGLTAPVIAFRQESHERKK